MNNLAKLFEDFLNECETKKGYSIRTVKAYAIDLKQFETYVEDKYHIKNVEEINKDIIKRFSKELLLDNKIKTVKRKIAVLMSIFKHFKKTGIITENPFSEININIKEEKVEPLSLTLSEMKRILKAAYKHRIILEAKNNQYEHKAQTRDIAILELLFATGAMVTELCETKKSDIDLKNRTIRINGQGGKIRTVDLCCDATVYAIDEYIKAFEDRMDDSDLFFINRLGKLISEQSIRFMVIRHAEMAKIKKHVTPHTFRHTLTELLKKSGLDKHYIQIFLGNKPNNNYPNAPAIDFEKQRELFAERHPRHRIDL